MTRCALFLLFAIVCASCVREVVLLDASGSGTGSAVFDASVIDGPAITPLDDAPPLDAPGD